MDEKTFVFFEFLLELRSIKIGFTFTWNPSLYLVVCSICKNFNNVEHPGNWMIAMWRISAFRIILMWQQWKATSRRLLALRKKNAEKKIFVRYIFRLGSGIYKVFFPQTEEPTFCFFYVIFLPLKYINQGKYTHSIHLVFSIRICKAIVLWVTWFYISCTLILLDRARHFVCVMKAEETAKNCTILK